MLSKEVCTYFSIKELSYIFIFIIIKTYPRESIIPIINHFLPICLTTICFMSKSQILIQKRVFEFGQKVNQLKESIRQLTIIRPKHYTFEQDVQKQYNKQISLFFVFNIQFHRMAEYLLVHSFQYLFYTSPNNNYFKSKMKAKFDMERVISSLERLKEGFEEDEDIKFKQFCDILDQFCVLFNQYSDILGVAFSDVKEKRGVIEKNCKRFSQPSGFLEFVRYEMKKNIHIYNGENNKSKGAPNQYSQYNSTSRNLLRLMWFLTFIRVTFEQIKNKSKNISQILNNAYDTAFGQKHSWVIRKGAKIAMGVDRDRKQLIEQIMMNKFDENKFQDLSERFLQNLIPIHEALWSFYRRNKLTTLE